MQRFIPLGSTLLEHALAVAELARPLVEAVQRKDRDLASQVRRVVNSIALNVAEAHGAGSGNSRLRFESALGSLYEARAGLRLALAWGYFSQSAAAAALDAMDRLGARVYGMTKRCEQPDLVAVVQRKVALASRSEPPSPLALAFDQPLRSFELPIRSLISRCFTWSSRARRSRRIRR